MMKKGTIFLCNFGVTWLSFVNFFETLDELLWPFFIESLFLRIYVFKASRALARLLVITSVSDLVVHLVFFVQISLFLVCQVVTFTKRIKMAVLFWIFLDQICRKWIKLDQTWSNLIKLDFSPIEKCYHKKLPHLQKGWQWLFYFGFFLDQICPKLIKLDQTGFSPIKKCYYKKLSD